MVEFRVRRYAHLSDGTVVQEYRQSGGSCQGLSSVAAKLRVVCLCLSAGLLHTAALVRLPPPSRCAGLGDMGVLILFLHYHCCRPLLEGGGSRISATNDSRRGAELPGPLPARLPRYGDILGFRGAGKPCADDLLLPVYHYLHDCGLPRRGNTEQADAPFPESLCSVCGRCRNRYLRQYFEPLSYMGIRTGEHERKE